VQKHNIIDGKKISQSIIEKLKIEYAEYLIAGGRPACLAIILVGDDPASKIYIQNKQKAAAFVGMQAKLVELPSNIEENELLEIIHDLNMDPVIAGIIVQLPLPGHIDKQQVVSAISPHKDVDGFHPLNMGYLYGPENNKFVPCTALGCLDLIKSCIPEIAGKHAVVIGRSIIVGRPVAALLLKENCTVTICHSGTKNLADITKQADIVVSAIGKPKYLTKEYFSAQAVVIDVGISRIEVDGEVKLCGDVDFDNVRDHVRYITPVPGGVGPMTVAYLLVNCFRAAQGQVQ
jgi:methylenetetrahydrofolate dehydrogenase (NADP+)/methenyltetrahydrofolate cyclohydrolase